ncbi:Tetratricopeptide repeat-containing protein [Nonlabens sp. Hel1_33_55]|uniref:tetratricopeptide repeat protein n=1 Tax=Nonlabens sp. Hel1_33_55 TaxID=1336802 RepID=UPI000875B7C4|nr:tetratricopeptide repeat protein [Nonlabens sp. Hel1_33_55]SCY02305.1 Tetratricopeptide repeat-containing protein [Nonlabens sp. Hel1_33_55]
MSAKTKGNHKSKKDSDPAWHGASNFYNAYKWQLFITTFVAAFLLYANTLGHNFVLDDKIAIVDNEHVLYGLDGISDLLTNSYMHGFDGSNRNTYRPISLISFAFEQEIFGGDPFYFHLMNVLSFGLLCLLVARLLFFLLPDASTFILLAILALFISHPIHTEVVANIKSRDEIYSMLFGVLSLILFLKHEQSSKLKWLVGYLLTFLASLLSKENTITLLAIFPLTLYFFRNYSLKNAIARCWPLIIPVLVMFLLRLTILDSFVQTTNTFNNWQVPYNNTLFAAETYLEEFATNCSIFLKYFEQSVFPTSFAFDYSVGTFEVLNFTDGHAIAGLIVLLVMIFVAVIKFKSRSLISFSLLFFLITFSITSNFIFKIGATLGERFLFLPSFGVVILMGYLGFKVLEKMPKKLPIYFLLVISLVSLYSFQTIQRNSDWKDMLTLAEHDIQTNPDSGLILVSLGQEYKALMKESADTAQARFYGIKSIANFKKSIPYFPNVTDLNYSIADTYLYLKEYQNAVKYFEKSFPTRSIAEQVVHFKLGLSYENLGNNLKASQSFEKAVAIDPTQGNYWRRLAYSYFPLRNYDDAIAGFKKSNELRGGNNVQDLLNIALSHQAAKNIPEAIKYNRIVLNIDPNNVNAMTNLRKMGQAQ